MEREAAELDEAQERPLASRGPAWDAAVAFGVDMNLLLANLERTPTERLQVLQRTASLHALLRKARRVDE